MQQFLLSLSLSRSLFFCLSREREKEREATFSEPIVAQIEPVRLAWILDRCDALQLRVRHVRLSKAITINRVYLNESQNSRLTLGSCVSYF